MKALRFIVGAILAGVLINALIGVSNDSLGKHIIELGLAIAGIVVFLFWIFGRFHSSD